MYSLSTCRHLSPDQTMSLTVQRPILRTYGKRAAPDNAAATRSKKRRIVHDDADILDALSKASEKAGSSKQLAKQDEPQLPPPTAQQPKKGTILSYFKVRSPSSGTSSSSCAQSSELATPTSTPPTSIPPSSPAVEVSRKRPRRLTTKASNRIGSLRDSDHGTSASSADEEKSVGRPDAQQQDQALQDTSATLLNQKRSQEASQVNVGTRSSKRQKSKKATIQTTISLSLDEKQFLECTECTMVYNPYHEADVKLHKRRHAAFLRSKRKKKGAEKDLREDVEA